MRPDSAQSGWVEQDRVVPPCAVHTARESARTALPQWCPRRSDVWACVEGRRRAQGGRSELDRPRGSTSDPGADPGLPPSGGCSGLREV